jgi:tRNA-specific 2-thiouridylase
MKNSKAKKIIVAMSGGVDSSVAAKLLVDQGHEVAGIFLHFWKDPSYAEASEDKENKCCSLKALMDARRVCQKIGIPLYTMDFSQIFKKEIVDNFLYSYQYGLTPNPCVRCNKLVKLGLLIERAKELGFDYVASGHYAKSIINYQLSINNYGLYRAKDKNKDQSYFLHMLSQEQLARMLFPLGDYTKDEARALARKFKLPVAEKKESQEICFVASKSHNDFLKRYLKLKSGPIVLISSADWNRGEVIGEHKGLPLYTIGQRKGVEIGGTGPFYVVRADYKTNTLYVARNFQDELLYGKSLIAENVNWISGQAPKMPFECEVVIRYRHKSVSSKLKIQKSKNNKLKYLVEFSEPQRAVTPGQSVVFYQGEEVIGGGVIGQ